jgi:spermidine synthase
MKIENLISKVLFKAAPMLPTEHKELETNMFLWFDQQKQAVEKKIREEQTLNMKDKAFKLLDEWYIRALFAMAYIFIVRWVQDFMNPADPDGDYIQDDILDRK